MNLSKEIPREELILALAEKALRSVGNPTGACGIITSKIIDLLKEKNIKSIHVIGGFRLDNPDAFKYMEYDDESGHDEYQVNHDWVEVDDKILDGSISQFSPSVNEALPRIFFGTYDSKIGNRYEQLGHG
jgi:hypothetical protein